MKFFNKSFLKNEQSSFHDLIARKEWIAFGAGAELTKSIEYHGKIKMPKYIVDNNKSLWGKEIHGIPVRNPEMLECENPETYVVLITTQFFFSIEAQLINLGVKYYFASLLFLERYFDRPGHAADMVVIPL